ncbi:MAG: hypothetical protein ABI333_18150 [bacterium]
MHQPFNRNLQRTLSLTREMLALADEGDRDRTDDACGIIFGILRDTAYRLRKLAQEECDKHRTVGKWVEDDKETVGSV